MTEKLLLSQVELLFWGKLPTLSESWIYIKWTRKVVWACIKLISAYCKLFMGELSLDPTTKNGFVFTIFNNFLNLVNLCQKHLFLYQLTHNMTTDCSLNYEFDTWKIQAQNMLCTQIVCLFLSRHSEQFMYTTCSGALNFHVLHL